MNDILAPFVIWIQKEYFILLIFLVALLIEVISRKIKRRLKKSIFSQYDQSTDPKHAEYYLEYYRKTQIIDIVRVISVIATIAIFLATKTNTWVNFFVVAAGALIITFKDFLLSILAFFFTLPQYKIGDTVAIWDIQGQIIFIRMFSIWLLGKDNDGDSTGKLFLIPSYKFLIEPVRREELTTTSTHKELLKIPFKTDEFSVDFSKFLSELELFLDKLLPVCNRKNAGNYQTYIGHKYKMDIDYLEDKCIIITIGIIGKWEKNVENKRKIVEFAEFLRDKK